MILPTNAILVSPPPRPNEISDPDINNLISTHEFQEDREGRGGNIFQSHVAHSLNRWGHDECEALPQIVERMEH